MLCCLAPALVAADGGPDRGLVALKSATLDLIQAQPAQAEAPGSLAIYIGNSDAGLLLDQITVWIDDAPALRYEYSDRQSLALHQGGLHRLAVATLSPGEHRFRADFAARVSDAPPDHLRQAGTLDRRITVMAQPATIELDLVSGGYLGRPGLEYHVLSAGEREATGSDRFADGSRNNPRVRYAAFLTATDQPFAAAGELLRLQAQRGGATLPADFYLQLAGTLQAFGLSQRALQLYQRNGGTPPCDCDAQAQAYTNFNRGVALLRDGQLAEGAALLAAIASAKGDSAEAATLRDRANLQLGYAQLRNHTGAKAVPMFGNVRSTGPYTNAALLGLGWALLAPSGNGAHAVPAKADAGAAAPLPRLPVLLQPQLTADIAPLQRRETYRLKTAAPEEEKALRRALVPWLELTGRDPLDPAVQEGMIAIPYALNHIGAFEEAEEHYHSAVKLLEAVDAQLDVARQRVAAGQMVQALDLHEAADNGWPWWITAYPKEHWWLADDPADPLGAPPTFYLQHVMAQDDFRAALQDFHDLRLMEDSLAAIGPAAAELRAQLAAARAGQAQLLQQLAQAELDREQRYTRMYLGEARFALAHINEPPPPAPSPVAAR